MAGTMRIDAGVAGTERDTVPLVRALAALVMLVGATALTGWWAGIPVLTSIAPGYVTMKANTALAILSAGAALWMLAPPAEANADDGPRQGARWIGHAWAGLCAAIGAATIAEYATGLTGIDQLLAHVSAAADLTPTPGRMALTTAATLVALGAGLLTLDLRGRVSARASQWCLAAALAVPLGVVVGYLYRVIPVRGAGQGLQMALHTALACLAVGVGAVIARPEREFARTMTSRGTGGVLARRLIPAAVGIPIVLGALRLVADASSSLTASAGGASVTTGTMFLFAWLIWRTASEIDASEESRVAADRDRATAVEARAVAEAASAEKTRFLAVMSHELRTPLNAIVGFTDLLDAGIYGPATLEQRAALARVRRSSQHLLGLVDQVLTVARVESCEPESLDLEEVAMDELLASIAGALQGESRARNIHIVIEPIGSAGIVRADRRRVAQVMAGLISNAVKFSAAGCEVRVVSSVEEPMLAVRVSDAGCGVPADKREAIFAPFVQAEMGHTRTRDGVGLGLSISRSFARVMGGDVTLERSDARGSVFVFRMPRDCDVRRAAADGMRRPTPPLGMRAAAR